MYWHECREITLLEQELKLEAEIEGMKVLLEAQEERLNEGLLLRRVQVQGKAATREIVDLIQSVFQELSGVIQHAFFTKSGRRQFIFFLVAAALLAFGVVSARELVTLIMGIMQRILMTPSIVREYGNLGPWTMENILSILSPTVQNKKEVEVNIPVVLNDQVKRRLGSIVSAALQAQKRHSAPMRNLLIYGPCGTGKSMMAKMMARDQIKLPYAIMSGADLAPLGRRGPLQLKQLLQWANRQQYGSVVIIDEAECALGSRIRERRDRPYREQGVEHMSYARDALNVLLSMTGDGTANIKCMLILVTSKPDVLDEAVLNRMDEMIYLDKPGFNQRKEMLHSSFYRHFQPLNRPTLKQRILNLVLRRHSIPQRYILTYDSDSFDPCIAIASLVQETEGWNGRELEKLMQAVISAVYSCESCVLTMEVWLEVTISSKRSLYNKRNNANTSRYTDNIRHPLSIHEASTERYALKKML